VTKPSSHSKQRLCFSNRSTKAIVLAVLLGLMWFGIASAQEDFISFGIRPTEAIEGRPETFSYFSYVLEPGDEIADAALVLSESDVPLDLQLYAADGITNQNGGTGFMIHGESSPGGSHGVAEWVTPSVDSVHLEPGDEIVVPFILEVPPDATAGHHVAGLVVELASGATQVGPSGPGPNFTVNVVQRVGVAVVVEVPGDHVYDMQILDVGMHSQDQVSATFFIRVFNSGNMMIKGTGLLQLMETSGELIALIRFDMDTVLPGDTALFYIPYPGTLPDGAYLLSVSVDYEDKTAELDGVLLGIRDGQPWSMGGATVTPSMDGEPDQGEWGGLLDNPNLLFAIVMFIIAGFFAIVLFVIIRRVSRD
jgi:hypothetical protein